MRITFLVSNYYPSVGGAQSSVQRIAEGLVARHGHDVHVLTTDAVRTPGARYPGRVDAVREEQIAGVHVRRIPLSRRGHALIRFARRIRVKLGITHPTTYTKLDVGPHGARLAWAAYAAGRDSDAVVGVGAPFLTLLAADLMTRRTDAAYIAMPLLHLAVEDPYPWILRSLLRADGVSCATVYERDWLVNRGVDKSRTAVLPPGCDPDRYAQTSPAEARRTLGLSEALTVGYIGRFAANKGLDTFARAAERIWQARPDVTIFIVGRSSGWIEAGPILDRLHEVGGARFVHREGFDESERSDVFAACDVIAFPSQQESFGMITVEAWCARRPVVAGDIGAVRCVIHDGIDGELVGVQDDEALARQIVMLLEDPDRRLSYGTAGRARAESEFSWQGIVDRWDDFLENAVERKRCLPSRDQTKPRVVN